jgi:hypothetical protein
MHLVKSMGVVSLSYVLGFVAGLAGSGVALSLLWWIGASSTGYRLATALISAAAAFLLGGAIVARLSRSTSRVPSAAFGFVFGSFAFTYVLGPTMLALAMALGAAAMALAGGELSRRMNGPHLARHD